MFRGDSSEFPWSGDPRGGPANRYGERARKTSPWAAALIATTAGCFNLRSAEIA
jgi:hypothetical protein